MLLPHRQIIRFWLAALTALRWKLKKIIIDCASRLPMIFAHPLCLSFVCA